MTSPADQTEVEPLQPTKTSTLPSAPSAKSVVWSILHGSMVYGMANFGIKAINYLVLLPLYTRYLTPADYGTIGLAETVAMLLVVVCSIGMQDGMRRLYFQYVENRTELLKYTSTMLSTGIVTMLCMVALALACGPLLQRTIAPGFSLPFYPFAALAIGAAAAHHIVDYRLLLFQVEKRPQMYMVLAISLFLLISGFAVTLVVFFKWGAYGMLLGKLLATVAGAAISLFLLRRWLGHGWHWSFVSETLVIGLPLVPFRLTSIGLDVADRFIMQRYRPMSELGIYTLGYSMGMVMSIITLSLWQAWSPIYFDLARHGDEKRPMLGRLSSALVIVLIGVGATGALLAQPFVHAVLDPRYAAAAGIVPWIIGGYLCHAVFTVFQLAALQAKRTKFMFAISTAAVILNIGLNLWLVPKIGMYGAAYATLAAFALEAIIMYVYAQKVYRLPYNMTQILAGLVIFGAVVAWCNHPLYGASGWIGSLTALVIALAVLMAISGREITTIARMVMNRAR